MIAEKNGFTNVANEYFKRGSTDFYPVATRLVNAKPDLIDFGGTIGRDQSLGCKALRELGYKGKIMLGYSDAKSFVEVAGARRGRGHIAVRHAGGSAERAAEGAAGLVAEEIRPAFPHLRVTRYGTRPSSWRWDEEGAIDRPGEDRRSLARRQVGRVVRPGSIRHEIGLWHRHVDHPRDSDRRDQGRQARRSSRPSPGLPTSDRSA